MPRRRPAHMPSARWRDLVPDPITAEHWREALVFMASVVESYGDVYAPVLEEVERRYEAALHAERPRDRARRILETYTRDGDLKAIR
ncbi:MULTISPECIES: hypothetical protein [Methylobacterium]|uniref:hypothetical protein n=1 Tax=Methylobacterium TaxID=407 RepID=UPI0013EC038D|nr:hypothetical protein [Methylobacterium sp. DB0501]NGM38262.1 hypothetical protein [Methylobacterium sp. DB0501]